MEILLAELGNAINCLWQWCPGKGHPAFDASQSVHRPLA
jgi:hypothetical protein